MKSAALLLTLSISNIITSQNNEISNITDSDSSTKSFLSDVRENDLSLENLPVVNTPIKTPISTSFDQSELDILINLDLSELPYYDEYEIMSKLEAIPTTVPLRYTPKVKQLIEHYAYSKRGYITRMLTKSQDFFPVFEEVLMSKNMPTELKYLPIVESALNPNARSRCGATGLWQFMYSTAKYEGLKINSYVDERKDIYKSTQYATNFLNKLYYMYYDWNLALAAYNAGPGNVNRALSRTGGYDFWSCKNSLPRETQNYVPTFTAILFVMYYHTDYKLMPGVSSMNLSSTFKEKIYNKCTLKYISELSGANMEQLKTFNPSLKKGIIPATAYGFDLVMPNTTTNNISTYRHLLVKDPYINTSMKYDYKSNKNYKIVRKVSYKKKWVRHRVRRGENLSTIAKKHRVYVSDIKRWNKLRSSRINSGRTLKIYARTKVVTSKRVYFDAPINTNKSFATTEKKSNLNKVSSNKPKQKVVNYASNTSKNNNTQKKYLKHKVSRGETLYSISREYSCTVKDLYAWNKLRGNTIYVGQSLVVKATIPADNTIINKSNLAKLYELTNYKFYTASNGDTLQTASTKLNIPIEVLTSLNNIDKLQPLREGETIKVPMY